MKRLKYWFNHIFIKYIPSSQQISNLEAKRLSKYISSNYSIDHQKRILEDIRIEVIEVRKNEIATKAIEIAKNQDELFKLKLNLEKLLSM